MLDSRLAVIGAVGGCALWVVNSRRSTCRNRRLQRRRQVSHNPSSAPSIDGALRGTEFGQEEVFMLLRRMAELRPASTIHVLLIGINCHLVLTQKKTGREARKSGLATARCSYLALALFGVSRGAVVVTLMAPVMIFPLVALPVTLTVVVPISMPTNNNRCRGDDDRSVMVAPFPFLPFPIAVTIPIPVAVPPLLNNDGSRDYRCRRADIDIQVDRVSCSSEANSEARDQQCHDGIFHIHTPK